MTEPGRRFGRRSALQACAGAIGWLLPVASASAQPPAEGASGLEALLAVFRESPGLAARFVEEKHIALLKAPLKSEGALYFLPQDKLARHVERPQRSVLLLEGTTLRIADKRGARSLDLGRSPGLAALAQSFAHVLRGDRAALEKSFRVEFRPTEKQGTTRWQLRLVPRGELLRKLIESIEMTGEDAVIETLEVTERNGDRSITRFSDVETKRRFTDEERKRLFSVRAS